MGKRKYFHICLVAALVVTLLFKPWARDNEAEAAVPLVVSMLPVVLSAIVTGSAIGWTQYNANGQQAWLRFTGAVKDGVAVTKDWIQKQIAEMNGIDTEPSGNHRDGNVIQYGGRRYSVSWSSYGIGPATPQQPFVYVSNPARIYEVGAYSDSYNGVPRYANTMWIISADIGPAPSGFNPADHQELFNGPGLFANCAALADYHPDLELTYEVSDTAPDGVENATIQDISAFSSGYVIGPDGKKYDLNDVMASGECTLTDSNGHVHSFNATAIGQAGQYIQRADGSRLYLSDALPKGNDFGLPVSITAANGTVYSISPEFSSRYVDSQGNIIKTPPQEVLEKLDKNVKELDKKSVSDGFIASSKSLPQFPAWMESKLKGAGIDLNGGGVINSVGAGRVNWTDAQGNARTTLVDSSLGAALAVAVGASGTRDNRDARKLLPGWVDTRLKGAGVDLSNGGVIDSVGAGRVNWTDAQGNARTTLVDSALADALAQAGARVQTTAGGMATTIAGTPTMPGQEPDPGDPSDPNFAPGVFDPDFDWGEKKEFNIDAYVATVGSLPLMAIFRGSKLNLTNSNPVLNFSVNGWPGVGSVSFSVDFSRWENVFRTMGSLIYFVTLIDSIALAFLGRRI